MLPPNTGSLHAADKQTVTRRGVRLGNISNTYVGVQTWRRADGFHMNEWLKRGAWERLSTYSHSRTPFSNADRKSLLPNFFLVTAWKKRDTKTVSERGWVRSGGVGFCVCVCVCGWAGRLEKKGRMLRTVAEEVRGISS